jgi:hypothetical protein
MTTITEIKLITIDNIHIAIPTFISENNINITCYEDMVNVVLQMIQSRIFINIDKDLLRTFLEDLTFMYCPEDDMNRDKVYSLLAESDSDDEEEHDDMIDNAPRIGKR